MDTLKTVFVVSLLGVVLYGAYTLLTKEESKPPQEIAELAENLDDLTAPDVDMGPSLAPGDTTMMDTDPATYADLNSTGMEIPSYASEPSQPSVTGAIGGIVENVDLEAADPYSDLPVDNANEASRYVETRPAYGNEFSTDVPSNRAPKNPISNPFLDSEPIGGADQLDTIVVDWATEKKILDRMVLAAQHGQALKQLSQIYRRQSLTPTETTAALAMLDPLAGKVIYSREHLLEDPYIVKPNESLMQIAEEHRVPWELLRNINGIDDRLALEPGTPLKVVRGPFEAEIDTVNSELTLYVNNMYAGRFTIAVGPNPSPSPGKFQIVSKEEGKSFLQVDGKVLPIQDTQNPYGSVWLDLGGSLGIHGSNEATPTTQGCISLSPVDAADVFAILSAGSTVVIR